MNCISFFKAAETLHAPITHYYYKYKQYCATVYDIAQNDAHEYTVQSGRLQCECYGL
jgi:hypothetical protein